MGWRWGTCGLIRCCRKTRPPHRGKKMSKVTTFITFKERGAEAVEFYTSLFENSKVHWIHKSGANGPMPEGALMHAMFEIDGQQFMAMDGGPSFAMGPGFSM